MKTKWMFGSFALLLCLFYSGSAEAAEPGAGVEAEVAGPQSASACTARFDLLDKDKDGKLIPEEFSPGQRRRGRGDRFMNRLDLDGDGVVTKEEFCERRGRGRGKGTVVPLSQSGTSSTSQIEQQSGPEIPKPEKP